MRHILSYSEISALLLAKEIKLITDESYNQLRRM
jgi:hypothetical protein